jgi:hypothetical protein
MVDPRRVLIIEAAADTCVPRTSRERLWRAMGRPERIAYLYDHRVAFLAMTFLGGNNLQQQIYRFLDRRFPDAPRGGTLPERNLGPERVVARAEGIRVHASPLGPITGHSPRARPFATDRN